ncbi:type II secretion system F family protein [Phosphitispora sp. TUW77]|uniref:type II secretion system F family protein n=1 Tax=Phosphitispora sp. TUW77 TaxID=3152361 RepID=UPI003AB6BEF3
MIKLTDYNIYLMERAEKTRYILLAAIALFGIGYIFFNNLPAALAMSLGSFLYPRYAARKLAEKRRDELNSQFKDALYSISSALSAGNSLESSFREALRDLRVLYPEPDACIVRELEYICRRMEINEPLEKALQDFAQRSGLEDISNFADVVGICKRTGGNLVHVVKNTSNMISDRIEVAQEIELLLTRQNYERKILNVMPFLFIALMRFAGGGYMDSLYTSPRGYLMMAAALGILALSYLVSGRIMDIKI